MDGQRQARRSPVRSCDHHPAGGEPSPDITAAAGARTGAPAGAGVTQLAATGAGQLSDRWAAVLGIGWPLAIVASMVLEPTPADPSAPGPVLAELANLGLLFARGHGDRRRGAPRRRGGGRRRDRPARRALAIACLVSGHPRSGCGGSPSSAS